MTPLLSLQGLDTQALELFAIEIETLQTAREAYLIADGQWGRQAMKLEAQLMEVCVPLIGSCNAEACKDRLPEEHIYRKIRGQVCLLSLSIHQAHFPSGSFSLQPVGVVLPWTQKVILGAGALTTLGPCHTVNLVH